VRNPVLAAAVISSVLLTGLVVWHSRGDSDEEGPAVDLGIPAACAQHKHSRLERGAMRSSGAAYAAVSADALWTAAEQVQRELHSAKTRPERERLLGELEAIVRQMNALQADGSG
jgi:hypothetical protein